MILKNSETKFYNIKAEKKLPNIQFQKHFSTFKKFHFVSKMLTRHQNAFLQAEIAQIMKL